MANLQKYPRKDVGKILRHNDRKIANPANKDIDPSRSHLNYSLIPDDKSALERYNERISQLYCYNRKDVKTLCSWVITAPKSLDKEQHEAFFAGCYDFVANRYGEENMVQAWVHMDESTPHIHINYIPATEDPKHGREKVCANEVNDRYDLMTFHRELEESLLERGIRAEVYTGITRLQGGNKTVEQLKAERDKEVNKNNDEHVHQDDDEHRVDDGKEERNMAATPEATKEFRWEDYVADPRFVQREQEHDVDLERGLS